MDEYVKGSFLKGDYEECLEKTLKKLTFDKKSVNAEWDVEYIVILLKPTLK